VTPRGRRPTAALHQERATTTLPRRARKRRRRSQSGRTAAAHLRPDGNDVCLVRLCDGHRRCRSSVCGAVACTKGQQQQEGSGAWDDWVRVLKRVKESAALRDILVVIMSSENVPTRIIPLPGGV
jgi:hypothetical protein